jgi:hypothetical protein
MSCSLSWTLQIKERFPDMASMVKDRLLLIHEAERLAKVTHVNVFLKGLSGEI